MSMPSATKFVEKTISLHKPQYIGLKNPDYDPRGIPVRIWAWHDDDGTHIRVESDRHGTILYKEDEKVFSDSIDIRVVEQPVWREGR